VKVLVVLKGNTHSNLVSLPSAFAVWTASEEAAFTKGKFIWCNWDVDELKQMAPKITSSPFLTLGLEGWPFM
jgi:hypothetical protein